MRLALSGGMDELRPAVVGVVGASGGVGASTFAAVLAAVAGRGGRSTLLDLDVAAGGIDVLLGAEEVDGPRWSGLRLGGGRLEPDELARALPRWGAVSFVAADVLPTPAVLSQTVAVANELGPVVLDVPRWSQKSMLTDCDLVIVVAGSRVHQVTAARALAVELPRRPALVAVRAGGTSPTLAGELIGLPFIGTLPARLRRIRADLPLTVEAASRGLVATVLGIVDVLEGGLIRG
jgi:hypothetical protein